MNWDVFKSNWKQFKDRLTARWRSWDMTPIAPIAAERAPADWPISQQRIERPNQVWTRRSMSGAPGSLRRSHAAAPPSALNIGVACTHTESRSRGIRPRSPA